jgi:predicted esterase
MVALDVVGHGDAVVSLPLGASEPRPVVLATHGNYDTPEWQCEIWRQIVANDAFVLCPRGIPRSDSPSRSDLRYEYASRGALEKEIDAAFEALRARYSGFVDDGPRIFTGFSLGAIMGASIILRNPAKYPRAVLIEGGNRVWNVPTARAFAQKGGQGILFACGQWDCVNRSRAAGRALQQAGVVWQVLFAKGEGHTYGGRVAEQIHDTFAWLVQGDPRFRAALARRQAGAQSAPPD